MTRASHSESFVIKVNFRNQSSVWLSWCLFDLTFWDVPEFCCSLSPSPWPWPTWEPPRCWGSRWSSLCPPRGDSPGSSSAGSGSLSQFGLSSDARVTPRTCWGYFVFLLLLLLLLPTSPSEWLYYFYHLVFSYVTPIIRVKLQVLCTYLFGRWRVRRLLNSIDQETHLWSTPPASPPRSLVSLSWTGDLDTGYRRCLGEILHVMVDVRVELQLQHCWSA